MRATFVLGAVFALSFPAFAQTGGQVTGLVTDPSGSAIVGATVTITNSQTNLARKTTTNSDGYYSFPALQPDVYGVKAEMMGFKGEVREGVELQVEQIASTFACKSARPHKRWKYRAALHCSIQRAPRWVQSSTITA